MIEEVLEENKEKNLALETIKAEAIDLNENLRLEHKEFLCVVNDMQDD
jgi:hypothetical protein